MLLVKESRSIFSFIVSARWQIFELFFKRQSLEENKKIKHQSEVIFNMEASRKTQEK